MLTEDVTDKVVAHEAAAHEKRNWVRLTFDCNNHCVFCLDTLSHDGQMRDPEDVKRQILDGARKGAQRLILSGGEPTMHPRYVDFIRLGKLARYKKIQTVTNGRMFGYREFLTRCLDAGLDEITFSVHGPNARIHDALVGVKGAFDQEVQGIQNALEDGRPIVNIDVVINRGNVKHLRETLDKFITMGVREYDLLHVIPFGNAYREGRNVLFYDLEEMRPYLLEAFAFARRPDVHIWLNRFPVQHLEGFEDLIQDPYKLNDEVKGRKEEYHRLLTEGVDLDCRDPARCKLCYLQNVCDTLYEARDRVNARSFETVRVDTEWESRQGPIWGGDPASSKRARVDHITNHFEGPGAPSAVAPEPAVTEPAVTEPAVTEAVVDLASGEPRVEPSSVGGTTTVRASRSRFRLPVMGGAVTESTAAPTGPVPIPTLVAESGASVLHVVAPDLARALPEIQRFEGVRELVLELSDYTGLGESLGAGDTLQGRKLRQARTVDARQAAELLAVEAGFEVSVALTRATAPWLRAMTVVSPRLALHQPTWERLTESARNDVDLREFFQAFPHVVPVEGVPACVLGRSPRPRSVTLDTAMMQPDGQLEVFRYIKRYIHAHYLTRSLRCGPCVHREGCEGMHVNYIRAHGYSVMQPVLADAE